MLIDEMLEYCKNDYSNKNRACTDCNHPCECPGDCSVCLYQIHYKHSDPGARHSYNCRFLDIVNIALHISLKNFEQQCNGINIHVA